MVKVFHNLFWQINVIHLLYYQIEGIGSGFASKGSGSCPVLKNLCYPPAYLIANFSCFQFPRAAIKCFSFIVTVIQVEFCSVYIVTCSFFVRLSIFLVRYLYCYLYFWMLLAKLFLNKSNTNSGSPYNIQITFVLYRYSAWYIGCHGWNHGWNVYCRCTRMIYVI